VERKSLAAFARTHGTNHRASRTAREPLSDRFQRQPHAYIRKSRNAVVAMARTSERIAQRIVDAFGAAGVPEFLVRSVSESGAANCPKNLLIASEMIKAVSSSSKTGWHSGRAELRTLLWADASWCAAGTSPRLLASTVRPVGVIASTETCIETSGRARAAGIRTCADMAPSL
jgi:hypothetical protein